MNGIALQRYVPAKGVQVAFSEIMLRARAIRICH